MMGHLVAHSMTSKNPLEDIHLQFNFELFAHVTKFFGKKCIFLGLFNAQNLGKEGQDYQIKLRVKPGIELVKLVIQHGRVIGAVLIGQTDLEETMENLILNKTDIRCYGEDFLSVDVDLEDLFD